MKSNTTPTIEERALAMYKETVSPSKDTLVYILNQIPEIKETELQDRRAIRSPYRWLAVAQLASVFLIAIAILPSLQTPEVAQNPFYAIDNQVEQFEASINAEDAEMIQHDYTL